VRLEKPVAPPLTDCHLPEFTSITLPDFVPNLRFQIFNSWVSRFSMPGAGEGI
jgi:hypothetical protein